MDGGTALAEAAAALRRFLRFQELMAGEHVGLNAPAGARLGSVLSYETLRQSVSCCTRCALSRERTQVVFSTGTPVSRLWFVGEAPGAEEDLQGEPFVGPAGQLLDKMLGAIDLDRQRVCITNIVKCRPPANRDPLPTEIEACRLILDHQLALAQPSIVCALGRVAAQTLLGTDAPLNALRGRWHHVGSAMLLATYHPAALLRNESLKKRSWQDLKQVRAMYERMAEK